MTAPEPVEPFAVVDVTGWPLAPVEPAGRKQNKRWLHSPGEGRWLWKQVTEQRLPDGRTWRKGEDWAEKIVAEVGELLGVPVATVDLAVRGGAPGSISRDLTSDLQVTMSLGNELLGGFISGYEGSKFHLVSEYTVENVFSALESAKVEPPPRTESSVCTAGWFTGYLVLDALVANSDRHHQNWGVLLVGNGSITLAPSFDHASSLGFQLSDDNRLTELDAGIDRFAARGISRHTPGKQTFVDLATDAARRSGTESWWRSQVERVHPDQHRAIVDRIPERSMSHPARMFTTALLAENRRRLLDALDTPR